MKNTIYRLECFFIQTKNVLEVPDGQFFLFEHRVKEKI